MSASITNVLTSFPNGRSGRRKPYLRVKYLNNQKCFFDIFLKSKLKHYNKRDKERRIPVAKNLPNIFRTVKPQQVEKNLVFEISNMRIVIKSNKRKGLIEYQLLSLYPIT